MTVIFVNPETRCVDAILRHQVFEQQHQVPTEDEMSAFFTDFTHPDF